MQLSARAGIIFEIERDIGVRQVAESINSFEINSREAAIDLGGRSATILIVYEAIGTRPTMMTASQI
jgi:hypothetical protein